MKEIVDGSGLSKGAFYHYFNSKEQVFAEAIDLFIPPILKHDYSHCSRTSLRLFYNDAFNNMKRKSETLDKTGSPVGEINEPVNMYYLLLDAARMLPGFNEKYRQSQKDNLKAWKNIISTAVLTNEIRTPLNEEQLARLFINIADGVNFNVNLGINVQDLKTSWDSLYQTLKK